jgi:hypothetical protein
LILFKVLKPHKDWVPALLETPVESFEIPNISKNGIENNEFYTENELKL